MNNSSILSKAGLNSLQNSQLNSDKIGGLNLEKSLYYKSQISNNLIQQIGNQQEYKQVADYQTKFIDDQGNQFDQSQIQNQSIIKKKQTNGTNSQNNNKFIINESQQINQKQQSPIKQFQKSSNVFQTAPIDSSKITTIIHDLNDSPPKKSARTLLKDYKKNMSGLNLNLKKISNLNNTNGKQYLTNVRGLKQQDYYNIDYANTGKYKKVNSSRFVLTNDSIEKSNFFKKNDQLDQIQDILSSIKTLNNKNSKQHQYNALNNKQILPIQNTSLNRSSITSKFGGQKYKGNKNINNFESQALSKLDDLLLSYRFEHYESLKKSVKYEQKTQQIINIQVKVIPNNQSLKNDKKQISAINQRINKRRLQRQEKRKQNKYYQEVINQISNAPYYNVKKDLQNSKIVQKMQQNMKNGSNQFLLNQYQQQKYKRQSNEFQQKQKQLIENN